jgi:hypothetical protein
LALKEILGGFRMNSNFYDPKNPIKDDVDPDMLDLVFTLPETLFHIGQCYEDSPAETVACKLCNSTSFNVGTASYYTAIKCVNCGWECCVHNG